MSSDRKSIQASFFLSSTAALKLCRARLKLLKQSRMIDLDWLDFHVFRMTNVTFIMDYDGIIRSKN